MTLSLEQSHAIYSRELYTIQKHLQLESKS